MKRQPAIRVAVSPGVISAWRTLCDAAMFCFCAVFGLAATAFLAWAIYALLRLVLP